MQQREYDRLERLVKEEKLRYWSDLQTLTERFLSRLIADEQAVHLRGHSVVVF